MTVYVSIIISLIVLPLPALLSSSGRNYDDESKIYVHIVPHSHDDVGWLKTVDEYFYGANQTIQLNSAVQYIIDTVVQELQFNENRTFIYVEMAFFSRWWEEQDQRMQNIVRKLVVNKQLEFVNAGWCMNDEATTYYTDIIDQMTLGLQFVEQTFGSEARPRVAWHIDTFGHSSSMASLLSQMGFDGFFFARIDYDDYKKRVNQSTLEMVWTPSPLVGGPQANIFTGVLYNGYGPPKGFCFDHSCNDDPVQDNPDLVGYNVDQLVKKFVDVIYDQKKHYQTNHIMLTMGADFQYENAHEVYKNLEKLMKFTMENNSRVEVFYSTPSRYLDALNQANQKWTVKTDDFFPYADNAFSYWTGFFTSRPALKGYIRKLSSLLQTCKQLEAFAQILQIKRLTSASSRRLKEAMAVSQHHDAVSGTERQHVADDYAMRLHRGSTQCHTLIQDVLGSIMRSKSNSAPQKMVFCEYLNISICPEVEHDTSFKIVVYNPLMSQAPLVMWIPLAVTKAIVPLTVVDDTGTPISSQVQTVSLAVRSARRWRGFAPFEIAIGDTLPPLGFKTYFVRPRASLSSPTSSSLKSHITSHTTEITMSREDGSDFVIGTSPMQVTIDGVSGRIKAIHNTVANLTVKVDQGFHWYRSCDICKQCSGAYIFRPLREYPFDCEWNDKVHDRVLVKGDLYTEYRQRFNKTVFQTVRVYNNLPFIELDYVVGPIDEWDLAGKEVVSRFTTDLATGHTWYTDANGREMQRRVYNYRPTWNLHNTEPVAQNYYPVNSRIYIKDEERDIQFTIFTDRSQGGTSLNDGQLELMVHRRIFIDDHRGVNEPLDENGQFGDGLIIRGRHYILLDTIGRSSTLHRTLGRGFAWQPHPIFVLDDRSPEEYLSTHGTNFTFLNKARVPANVHLLTFEVLSPATYLLRIENFFDTGAAANISLLDLFVVEIVSVVELSLGGNAKAPIEHLRWATLKSERRLKTLPLCTVPVVGPSFNVMLNPMQIRTFKVTFTYLY